MIIRSAGIGRGSNLTTTRRLIKVAKWTMAAVVAVIVVAWAVRTVGLTRGFRGLVGVALNCELRQGTFPRFQFGAFGAPLPMLIDIRDQQPRPTGRPLILIFVPAWLLTALAVIAAAILFSIDRRRQPPAGQCRTCGYDLRGAVSDHCSECGTEINSEAAR